IEGQAVTVMIIGNDTLILANLDEASITSPRKFKDDTEYRTYMRYRNYAAKVFPYAVEAIRLFRVVENDTKGMSNRAKRKHIKDVQGDLETKFEAPLKNLTKTQGRILVAMISRELDTPIFDLIDAMRGWFKATYWSSMGMFYGYHLKENYDPKDDPILEMVLQDFNISQALN
ncbi:MAG: DUF4294 domain-containing protein, partial [Saprospiraceae bacterium]